MLANLMLFIGLSLTSRKFEEYFETSCNTVIPAVSVSLFSEVVQGHNKAFFTSNNNCHCKSEAELNTTIIEENSKSENHCDEKVLTAGDAISIIEIAYHPKLPIL